MEAILDIQNQVKPELFDQVVSAFYDVSNKDVCEGLSSDPHSLAQCCSRDPQQVQGS